MDRTCQIKVVNTENSHNCNNIIFNRISRSTSYITSFTRLLKMENGNSLHIN